jgi:hypothetical protein
MERDELSGATFGAVERVVSPLGAYVQMQLVWQGERLDRLLDADHAALQEAVVRLLEAAGWLVRVEVSFNHFGDRGRYDVLAFYPRLRVLLVVEIKTAVGDVQETLGRLDLKVRLARQVAGELGWEASPVVPALILLDHRTPRRHVQQHAALFRRFAVRGRTARAWLRRPRPDDSGLLLFMKLPNSQQDGSGARSPV